MLLLLFLNKIKTYHSRDVENAGTVLVQQTLVVRRLREFRTRPARTSNSFSSGGKLAESHGFRNAIVLD